MNVLVTGAGGFLGSHIISTMLKKKQIKVTATSHKKEHFLSNVNFHLVSLENQIGWAKALKGQNVIIHTAGLAHKVNRNDINIRNNYYKINVEGTLNLVNRAIEAGVKRFIYISSIKVNGELTYEGSYFTPDDIPAPEDIYGRSKLQAERGIQKILFEAGMEFVIIRPPLIYGPNVKGNFARIIRFIETGIPLPFLSISNKRSFVGIDNLVDLIMICITHPRAANQILLVSDSHDLSSSELVSGIAQAMKRPSRMFPCPPFIIVAFAKCIGKVNLAERLLGSMQVDVSKTRSIVGWSPTVTLEEGLRRCFPIS